MSQNTRPNSLRPNQPLSMAQATRNGVFIQDLDQARVLYERHNQHRPPRLDPRYLMQQRHEELGESDSSDSESDDESEAGNQNHYQDVPHMILVSSLDRDWTGNNPAETQYNFQIKFSPTSDSVSSQPLYVNNPTIPATIVQASQGLKGDDNTSGWTWVNGTTYAAYRADQPKGEIIGHEKIVEQGQKGAGLRNVYKNIVAVELVSFLTPGLKQPVDYHSSLTHQLIADPYYIVEIDEIEEIYDGSNKDLNKAFAVVVPIAPMYSSTISIARHVEYRTIDRWMKKYSPVPLNSLTNLTLRVKNPLGQTINNLNDILDINFVYQYTSDDSDTRNEVIVLQTDKYFSSNEYQTTDTIIIKNYQHRNTSSAESQLFNDFMNRSQGHHVLALSSNDNNLYLKNRIHIARPAKLDINNGGVVEESWYTTYKCTELDTTDSISSISTYDTGRLINLDMQNLYCFKIITREQNMGLLSLQAERV